MTTTTELSTSESEGVNDIIRGFEFINLNQCLARSFNQYLLYITENELKLTRKDKNKLGIHFIIKEIVKVCSTSGNKKWFYYKTDNKSIEHTLVKRIFNALPTNITYSEEGFDTFLEERDYMSFNKKDTSAVSFYKFRLFLRRYELQQIEAEFLSNINIKLSLLP
tara:strand:- start:487 stop:981 length:495 start_codon:yes stop_codon:yes gene_type:complete